MLTDKHVIIFIFICVLHSKMHQKYTLLILVSKMPLMTVQFSFKLISIQIISLMDISHDKK